MILSTRIPLLMTLASPLLLCACTSAGEDRDSLITWSGYLLDGPFEESEPLGGSEILAFDLQDQAIASAIEPEPAQEPGWYELRVPANTDLGLHISAPETIPSLWRTPSPGRDAWWLTGALFAYRSDDWMPLFEELQLPGARRAELDSEHCWLFGLPMEPEAWSGADIVVIHGDDQHANVRSFASNQDGILTPSGAGPVEEFFAFNLTAGDIYLSVAFPDGSSIQALYPSCSGELISAWYLSLPQGSP